MLHIIPGVSYHWQGLWFSRFETGATNELSYICLIKLYCKRILPVFVSWLRNYPLFPKRPLYANRRPVSNEQKEQRMRPTSLACWFNNEFNKELTHRNAVLVQQDEMDSCPFHPSPPTQPPAMCLYLLSCANSSMIKEIRCWETLVPEWVKGWITSWVNRWERTNGNPLISPEFCVHIQSSPRINWEHQWLGFTQMSRWQITFKMESLYVLHALHPSKRLLQSYSPFSSRNVP